MMLKEPRIRARQLARSATRGATEWQAQTRIAGILTNLMNHWWKFVQFVSRNCLASKHHEGGVAINHGSRDFFAAFALQFP
jgi:hypothetical protein